MVLNCSNLDCILQVSFSSLHDGGDDVFVILERKNGQKAMATSFFFLEIFCCLISMTLCFDLHLNRGFLFSGSQS